MPFSFKSSETFLMFNFWRSGSTDVYVDAVTIFTAPRAYSSTATWDVPGGNYRGQGVWVRYTDGSNQFSAFSEATTAAPSLSAAPGSLILFAVRNDRPPVSQTVSVTQMCGTFVWQVSDNADWLTTQTQGDKVVVSVNQSGLANGMYQGAVTISAVGAVGVTPVTVPVTLIVADQATTTFLPFIQR